MNEEVPMAAGMPGQRDAQDLRVRFLYGIFVVSGVCGLIYESIWSHYLKLFVGHAAYAQTVVLLVFIGGMAIGAALIGRFANRIQSPLVGYALAEALIGVISLMFHGVFVASTDWAYATLLPTACAPDSPCLAQWVFAAALILPQSILLGTTFPLMTSGVLRHAPTEPGRRIALLYFLNSIGAAAGVLLSGFVLLPAMGLPGTLLTAGLINIAVALATWTCAKGGPTVPLRANTGGETGGLASSRRLLIVVAALTGLSSFIYEIIWIRMLSLVVGTSTHSFELMLAAFIFGLAMGGLWVRKRIDRFPDLVFTLAVVQVLMGIAAVATLALYDGMFDIMSWLFHLLRKGKPGYAVYSVVNHALALAIMLPATFLAGMTFPLVTTSLLRGRDGEQAVGYTYAANTLGSIVGVVLAVHFALPLLGIKGGLLLGAAIDIALGISLFIFARRHPAPQRAMRWGAAGAAALVVVALFVPVLPERMATGVYRNGRAMLELDLSVEFQRDGKTATVTVIKGRESTSIATNGKPDAAIAHTGRPTSDEMTMVMTGLLPLAYRPSAKTAAVIGFGSGLTTATLLGSPVIERIDTIEIEPQMVEGARLFGSIVEPAFKDPRSRIIVDDAKSYFARSNRPYDLIISEPSNPWVSGVASLFTREFYARVKRQLNPDGLFVQWIQVYEFNDKLLATILGAIDAEFADYMIYAANQGDMVIVASAGRLPVGLAPAFTQWPGLAPLAARLGLQSADELEARRLAGKRSIRPLLAVFGEGINSDYFPVVDHEAPLARFIGESADGLMRVATAPVPVLELLGQERRAGLVAAEPPLWPPLHRAMTSAAKETMAFLRTGELAVASAEMRLRDIGMLRAVLWECAPLPVWMTVRELLLPVAGIVNSAVDRTEAIAFWDLLRKAPCAKKMTAVDQEWFDLFAVVGARDASAMAALATVLAREPDHSEEFRMYAVMAGAAGLLATQRAPEAGPFLGATLPMLSAASRGDPALRLLSFLAGPGQAQHAALAR